ncbi:hypothetical protein HJG54_00950 [Leptolyngbya sp. NK1-12]|uniref:Uncharacterized protein n=1 Tax=Leptolyngbya sp. NK1-12 TaxID=2547451 RepID=A0AA96WFT2_9CYAN|nr:hypothetical protein [Leptolyngbya sp. NK1-12]WNZ21576.1 hypothetical protein HJG54_00950 [Leptolyngbya sp. NK1-12]
MMQLKTGQVRKAVVSAIESILKLVEAQAIRAKVQSGNKFVKTVPMALNKARSLKEQLQRVEQTANRLAAEFPALKPIAQELEFLGPTLRQPQSSAADLLTAFRSFLDVLPPWIEFSEDPTLDQVAVTANDNYLFINFVDEGEPREETGARSFAQKICILCRTLRTQKRQPTKNDFIAIQFHDALLQTRVPIENPSRPLSMPGFGDYQTYLSITDPGAGLIEACVAPNQRGIIWHMEHLEREQQDRCIIEPYRITAIDSVAKVLARVGSEASCTVYIGRPFFESGDFKAGLLKAVRLIAIACSALFMQGVAECKIAIENMTATQIIEFIQCVRGEVRRDSSAQILSAAFNLNTPILDDREKTQQNHQEPVWIKDPSKIALLAVELVKAGGFDKVTCDGASNSYPSSCVLEQLPFPNAVEFVHLAHEQGLLTYFSAGFRLHHLPTAVYTGVDGVGVGGAQILRLMDHSTGCHGPFLPGNIQELLRIRDEAANDWLGQSAALLARLDQMFFEGCITAPDNALRLKLFAAIRDRNEAACTALLDRLNPIRNMPPNREHYLIEWAKRLLNAETPLLAATQTPEAWAAFVQMLQRGVKTHDLELLAQHLSGIREETELLLRQPYNAS